MSREQEFLTKNRIIPAENLASLEPPPKRISTIVNSYIIHLNSAGAGQGIKMLDVIMQFIFPSGTAGTFIGSVTVPVKISESVTGHWMLPASGILKHGYGHEESTIKATLVFISRPEDRECIAKLTTYNKSFSATFQGLTMIPSEAIIGDMSISTTTEKTKATIQYTRVTLPWGL